MGNYALTNIKFNGKMIPAGTEITDVFEDDEDALNGLIAAGAVGDQPVLDNPEAVEAFIAANEAELREALKRAASEIEDLQAENASLRAKLSALEDPEA